MYRLVTYSPLRTWQDGDYPTSPFLYLSVGTYSEEKKHMLLSAQLMTDSEIDSVVDDLNQELEEFRKEAKKELKTLRAKMTGRR